MPNSKTHSGLSKAAIVGFLSSASLVALGSLSTTFAQSTPTPSPAGAPAIAVQATSATMFTIRNDGGSRIQFVSDAPLETITGVSSHVTGSVSLVPGQLRSTRANVHVPIASIRTGIDLRDEHLRGESWLDAGHFPEAVFEITGFEGPSTLRAGEHVEGTVRGRFTLHGVTRPIAARVEVRWVASSPELRAANVTGDVLRVQATFRIQLSDFGISILAPVRLKVANELEVNVTLRATSATS